MNNAGPTPGGNQGGILGGLLGGLFAGSRKPGQITMQQIGNGPLQQRREAYSDDFAFCRSFNGLNIAITGCTGNIGSIVVDAILKNS